MSQQQIKESCLGIMSNNNDDAALSRLLADRIVSEVKAHTDVSI